MTGWRQRLKRRLDFSEPRQAFGVLMDGATARDIYLIILAVGLGIAFTVITGFPLASPIFTAFLKEELQFSDSLYGIFSALPWFTVIVQIPFSAYIRKHPRIKELFIPLLLTVRLSFVGLGILAAFIRSDLLALFTAIMFIFMAFASALNWMSDLLFNIWIGAAVPPSINGRFFSTRQTVISASTLIYSLLITLLTNRLGDWQYKYTLLFIIAGVFGCFDVLTFIFVRRPQEAHTPLPEAPERQPLRDRLKQAPTRLRERRRDPFPRFTTNIFLPLKDKRYLSYLLFTTLYAFGVQINSPYVNVYMLEVLQLPLGTQTFLAVLVPGIATVLFIRHTGQISDRFGFRNSLLLFGFLSAISPIPWLFIHKPTWWLIIPINFAWGITGVATDLAILSMSIFLAPAENRSLYISSKAIFTNLFGVVPGMLLGGFLSDALREPLTRLPFSFPGGFEILPFHVLLAIAAILRTLAIVVFVRRLPQDTDYDFPSFMRALRGGFRNSLRRLGKKRYVPAEAFTNERAEPTAFLDPGSNLSEDILPPDNHETHVTHD